ncbi:trypsin peptidase, putative [Bodo saltans]|uniref:Trypsin peptidase, putative n=1 Tax=Bodo saltans TaxID=75058 RepID=A0A0S4KR83_BODSA|nr:trypsin peptidase, putative [Bodo saltans]|eukprot:CUI15490.1 trypsin peptidase, putative [Bodo saltans]
MLSFGVSSYFLWTVKGATVMPLVRGSGFMIHSASRTFHKYHIVTAGHVACPVQFPRVFGDRSPGLRAIGERHISTGLLCPSGAGSSTPVTFPTLFPQRRFINADAAILHLKNEDQAFSTISHLGITPVDVDLQPLQFGEELTFCGVTSTEHSANASDDNVHVEYHSINGVSHSEVGTLDYGTVIAAQADRDIDPTMCGGPVLRKSNGKCVGVIVARIGSATVSDSPPTPDASLLIHKPALDLSNTPNLEKASLRVAFISINDFLPTYRATEG